MKMSTGALTICPRAQDGGNCIKSTYRKMYLLSTRDVILLRSRRKEIKGNMNTGTCLNIGKGNRTIQVLDGLN